MVDSPVAAGPTVQVGPLSLRFLGLELGADGEEVYEVAFRLGEGADWAQGRLRHEGDSSWALVDDVQASRGVHVLGDPDQVFCLALGTPSPPAEMLALTIPHWPAAMQHRLARRRTSGACTIAFDGSWFVAQLTGSAMDRPLILPDAATKLGLSGLVQAAEVLGKAADTDGAATGLIAVLQGGLLSGLATGDPSAWRGDGRLIGESTWGDLAQVGGDIADGCEAAQGIGPLRVVFDADLPMGLGFGPEVPSADVMAGREPTGGASVGTGAEVGEVDPGGAAEASGVVEGMVATRLSGPDLVLRVGGVLMPFEDILTAIDARRDAGELMAMTFDTAAPLTHWYAVEMPAASMLAALGAPAGERPEDAGVGASFDDLCGPALLWREPIPRLFLGDAGSVTCAHVDICPQIQLAHGLLGTKVLGVASHSATPRLREEHGGGEDEDGSIDEGATHVPTDRPLSPRQERLVADRDVCLLLLQPGDLAVIDSGALHFASNGAEGLAGALYHGVMTAPALPRLRAAAAASGGTGAGGEDAYGGHLFAGDLLRLVDRRLAGPGGHGR